MATPFRGLMDEVHVVLANRDKEFSEMVGFLQSCGYKVTTINLTPATISMLSKGKAKVDILIINVISPDSLCFKLLKEAVSLDIVTLIVCDQHNELLAKKAFNDGAYFYVKNLLGEEIVKYLWQFVWKKKKQREKARIESENQMTVADSGNNNNNNIFGDKQQFGEKNMSIDSEVQSNSIHTDDSDIESSGKFELGRKRGRKSTKDMNEGERESSATNKIVKRKAAITWTPDLHVKFAEAVQQLGEGYCLPNLILKTMNVPGLTRKHVSSYLQRWRIDSLKAPEERKFGRMPNVQTNVPNQTQRGQEFQAINTNNMFANSIQHQLYPSQHQVQSNYLNPFFSAQNNTGGSLQQQHGPSFGSQGPIIGSTNYMPHQSFNNGDHHDYNLELNAVNITPYPGTTMISSTEVGNATINGSGAANTNFHQYIGEQYIPDPYSDAYAIEGSDSNEKENCDLYFNFDEYLFPDLEPRGATLRNVYNSEFDQINFDQVNFDDQVAAIESVPFPGTTNFPDESST